MNSALFVESGLKHESAKGREMHETLSRPPCPFVSFVIHIPPKRPVQQGLEQMLGLALGFGLLGTQPTPPSPVLTGLFRLN